MDDSKATRLVEIALRCYPHRWRRRHAEEAAELAALLIKDGTPAAAIALSYLAGAAREWLTPRPGRRLSAVACALLVAACSLGVSAALGRTTLMSPVTSGQSIMACACAMSIEVAGTQAASHTARATTRLRGRLLSR